MKARTSWRPMIVLSVALCIMWTQIEPNAFARAQNGGSPDAISQTTAPQPSPRKSGKKKWFVILAAVGAAVVTAILVQKNSNTPSPTITVGPPTVG